MQWRQEERFIEEKRIHISLERRHIEEKLYIEVCCEADDGQGNRHYCWWTYLLYYI